MVRIHTKQKIIDYTVLFFLNAIGMILELVASRLLSPYFGNSNFVWTAIIGIILLAGSLGNIIGGKISSRKNVRLIMGFSLLGTAIYLALLPIISSSFLEFVNDGHYGVQFSTVFCSIVLFLIPATILGIPTPIVMHDYINKNNDKGKESGRITAIIAIGSLVGTFLGGFWLIPLFGTKIIFVILGCFTLLLTPFFVLPAWKARGKTLLLLISLHAIALSIIIFCFIQIWDDDNRDAFISIDTEYGRIIIENGLHDGEDVRYYRQSGSYSSATYLQDAIKYDLVFEYLKKYDEMFNFANIDRVLMIGGAAYQYPKYFISNFLDKKMDVVEIDPVSTEIAKKYFFLDDLINDFGQERLGLYNQDGRVFVNNCNGEYDAILNDAFSGEVPVGTLATFEAIKEIKECLKPGGVYMSNVLGAIEGEKGRFLRAELKTMRSVFRNVYVVPVYDAVAKDVFVNWMVIATDVKYVPSDAIKYGLLDEDPLLTDDYNPIDSLVSTDYFDN